MSNDKHITYLFGAGASYHAMPIQKELAREIEFLLRRLCSLLDGSQTGGLFYESFNKLNEFIENSAYPLHQAAKNFLDFQSVDTLAKIYQIQNEDGQPMLGDLKQCVDFYFYLIQFQPNLYQELMERDVDPEMLKLMEYRKKETEDQRYTSFLASILESTDYLRKSFLPKNVSILTYNYDVCLENAISRIFNIPITEIIGNPDERKGLFHINGIASDLNFEEGGPGLARWNDPKAWNGEAPTTGIRYPFELADGHKSHVIELTEESTHLVVIGYSFPVFNREIDRQILAAPKLEKIYIQDKEDKLDGIENRVRALLGERGNSVRTVDLRIGVTKSNLDGIPISTFTEPQVKIERVNSIDQFHIPFELTT